MSVIFLISSTLCIAVFAKIIQLIYNYYIFKEKIKNIRMVKGHPLLGQAINLMTMSDEERMPWYISLKDQFKEGIFHLWIGPRPLIHVYKPEFLEVIFPSTTHIDKGMPYEMLMPWLGNGLLISTGEQWFHDRKLIGPTFHFSILEHFAIVQSEKAEIFTKCLEKEIQKNPGKAIDIFPFTVRFALDVICETAMGVNIHAQEDETEYVATVHRTSRLTLDRMFRPWHWPDLIYNRTSMGKEYKELLKILHKFTRDVISKKIRERQSGVTGCYVKEEEDHETDIGKRKTKAFLDLLLNENEKTDTPFTHDELRAQVDTFMFEGHDTTAVAITWGLFLLGNNLDHQEKVHEELDRVFGNSEAPATMKDLSQLKYLDRIMKETLRLYPSVPIISRKIVNDIKIGNYVLPKDATVAIGIVLAHRNPEVWPDPEKFDPDRFLPENSKNRNPYAYVPFSAGPRNCIGQRFAQLEDKIALTAVLRKFRIKSMKTPDTLLSGGSLIFRPCEPVLLQFTKKKSN